MLSFAVFGGAFLARPLGGVLLGYIGDTYGRKTALSLSIFLMAFPTFAMGCLPSYQRAGFWSPILLVLIRLAQGVSVGGQLISSLVFTLENTPRDQWGLYGSFVCATGNSGTLLGGIVGYLIRSNLSHEQLVAYGWRIPFLVGVVVSAAGFYLHPEENEVVPSTEDEDDDDDDNEIDEEENNATESTKLLSNDESTLKGKPGLWETVLDPTNIRPLLAASLVPSLWSVAFYLTFVWCPVFMSSVRQHDELRERPAWPYVSHYFFKLYDVTLPDDQKSSPKCLCREFHCLGSQCCGALSSGWMVVRHVGTTTRHDLRRSHRHDYWTNRHPNYF